MGQARMKGSTSIALAPPPTLARRRRRKATRCARQCLRPWRSVAPRQRGANRVHRRSDRAAPARTRCSSISSMPARRGGDLMPMAEQVARAIAWAWRNAESFGGDRNRFYVSAHSSGAHLAACALSRGWREQNLPADFCKGALLVGGMYDLEPVRRSARSAYVKFTDAMEDALSPQRHIDGITMPLVDRLRHLRDAGIPAPVARLFRRAQSQGKKRRADRRRGLQSLRAVRDDGQSIRHRRPRPAAANGIGVSASFRGRVASERSGMHTHCARRTGA